MMRGTMAFLSILTLSNALVPSHGTSSQLANSSGITSGNFTKPPFTFPNSSSTFPISSGMTSGSGPTSGPLGTITYSSSLISPSGTITNSSSLISSSAPHTSSLTLTRSKTFVSNRNTSITTEIPTSSSDSIGISSSSSSTNSISSTSAAESPSSSYSSATTLSSSISTSNGQIPSSTSIPGTGILPFPTTSSPISTSPFSFTNSYTDIESTMTSQSFVWFAVPSSTISDATATNEAVLLSNLYFALQANRKWLTDKTLKSKYLEDVKRTQEETESLLKDLNVKPPDIQDCHNTKKKRATGSRKMSERQLRALILDRSIISSISHAIKNAAHDVAKLLRCADDVVKNLVNSVNAKVPDLHEIENLTDTLADIAENLKDDGVDDPSSTQGSSSSKGVSVTSASLLSLSTQVFSSTNGLSSFKSASFSTKTPISTTATSAGSSFSSTPSSSCSGSTEVLLCTGVIAPTTSSVSGTTTIATIVENNCVTSMIPVCTGSTNTLATSSSSGIPVEPTQIPAFVGNDTIAIDSALALDIMSFQQYLGCGPTTFGLPIPTAGCNLTAVNSTSSGSTTQSFGSTLINLSTSPSLSGSQTSFIISTTGPSSTSISKSKSASSSTSKISLAPSSNSTSIGSTSKSHLWLSSQTFSTISTIGSSSTTGLLSATGSLSASWPLSESVSKTTFVLPSSSPRGTSTLPSASNSKTVSKSFASTSMSLSSSSGSTSTGSSASDSKTASHSPESTSASSSPVSSNSQGFSTISSASNSKAVSHTSEPTSGSASNSHSDSTISSTSNSKTTFSSSQSASMSSLNSESSATLPSTSVSESTVPFSAPLILTTFATTTAPSIPPTTVSSVYAPPTTLGGPGPPSQVAQFEFEQTPGRSTWEVFISSPGDEGNIGRCGDAGLWFADAVIATSSSVDPSNVPFPSTTGFPIPDTGGCVYFGDGKTPGIMGCHDGIISCSSYQTGSVKDCGSGITLSPMVLCNLY